MIATDLEDVFDGLERLPILILRGADAGLGEGADLLQAVDQDTDAYIGQSGATRASSTAYPLDERASAKIAEGYAAAARALTGFTGHEGKPLSQPSGVSLADGEKGILLTSFTDYADALEAEHGGEKAHLGPTMAQEGQNVTRLVAGFIKTEIS